MILNESCPRAKFGKKCEFIGHYDLLKNFSKDLPLARKAKQNMYDPFIKEWKSFARDPKGGKKRMTGGPLEKAIRDILKTELGSLGVTVPDKAVKFRVWNNNVYILADVLAWKNSHRNIVSVKTWIGTEQIRETFAYAYLAKTWLGQKDVRVYQVGLFSIPEPLKTLIDACKPYLDGVFSLSSDPYLDVLVETMKHNFSEIRT